MVFKGINLTIKLGLVFLSTSTQIISKWRNVTLNKKAIYYVKPAHKSWNHYFVIFLGSFAIWGNGATTTHLPRGFTPTDTCRTKHSKGRCLGYVAFECHENISINSETLAHRDQQTCLSYVALNPRRWQISSRHLRSGSTINRLRTHFIFELA
jgi:hypothetical protein